MCPPSTFTNDVYDKANNITDYYAEISAKFDGNIEDDYAAQDLLYGIYYRNK